MLENLNKYKIVLASNSPRRHELMSGLEIDYEIKTLPDIDESYPESLKAEEIPLYISRHKAEAYRNVMKDNELIITADTIVYIDNQVLGKPKDEEDAKAMLHKLSGRTHLVITGVCLTTTSWQRSFSATTEVTFATLTNEEISHYVTKYKPLDKAGAYGVQELIGYIGVSSLKGSYYNVMGLPIQRLYRELQNI